MLSVEEARIRVARGAAHLDVVRPGWFNRIDVGTLTMWDPCGCIIGQVLGNFNDHCGAIVANSCEAVSLGLNLEIPENTHRGSSDWVALQDAWIEAIADRKLSVSHSQNQQTSGVREAVPDAV